MNRAVTRMSWRWYSVSVHEGFTEYLVKYLSPDAGWEMPTPWNDALTNTPLHINTPHPSDVLYAWFWNSWASKGKKKIILTNRIQPQCFLYHPQSQIQEKEAWVGQRTGDRFWKVQLQETDTIWIPLPHQLITFLEVFQFKLIPKARFSLTSKYKCSSQAWWSRPVNPTFGRQGQPTSSSKPAWAKEEDSVSRNRQVNMNT